MYTVVKAIGVEFGLNKRWSEINLTTPTVKQLFTKYRSMQITLLPAASTTQVFLVLADISAQYSTYTGTFQDLLISIGSVSLPVRTTGITLNSRHAHFIDAFRAGYSVTPVDSNNTIPRNTPTQTLPDVRLTRSDVQIDYNFFMSHCLVNINGYYHRTQTDGINGVVVKDAMKSLVKSGQNQIGLWSFTHVCDFEIVPILPTMVTATIPKSPNITLAQDLTNKTVMLFLGGHLVQVDAQVLAQISPNSFQLDFTKLDLVNRFYESTDYLDLSSVLAASPPSIPNSISLDDLTTPAAIAAWLALSQTFFVIFNCSQMYTQKQYIKRIGVPNVYISYTKPESPLVLEHGRQPPYWYKHEENQWALAIYNNLVGDLLYYTVDEDDETEATQASKPETLGKVQKAYLLEVGCDVS